MVSIILLIIIRQFSLNEWLSEEFLVQLPDDTLFTNFQQKRMAQLSMANQHLHEEAEDSFYSQLEANKISGDMSLSGNNLYYYFLKI